MFESFFAAVERLLGSKKALIVASGLVVNAAAVFGVDVDPSALTSGIGLVFNLSIAGLAVAQLVLDAIYGSASDGTVRKLAEQAGLEEELEDLRSFVSELGSQIEDLAEAAGEAEFEEDDEDFDDFVDDEEDE